ncbi:hypothetical protein [Streptomyces xanthophaeus]|uniref:hypothetical protein n=1 Tax=Streptomyces xanthophaeus TaxID=67385 RepID=UPI0026476622|nr:hypothetical protein [Streptomyces xanthophaeus]WKD30549.1 hypothetical protein KO717_00190 [Streptomyces xanthophaeus]WKD36981.1 hypothetical protein KO717_37030 [Streptomyces xanthophaeus]
MSSTAEPEAVPEEALGLYLPVIDAMIAQPFPAAGFEDATGYGGPDHRVRVLRASEDFWDDAYHRALNRADAQMSAVLGALAAALTVRWGDPLTVDLGSYLEAGFDGRRAPEPVESLSQSACSMQVWTVPGSGRWIGLTVGQHDTELPLELMAVAGRTPLPALSADGAG